ncbi:MAG: hypothetical protein Q8M94_17785, partial [Ignavibacteria bacterium]|nr:hypothetical protein [Ignavibacteria bacterium]
MDLEQLEIQETELLENFYQSNAVKFNKLKHTYFKDFLKKSDTYLDFLKVGTRHFAFQLPENIDEIFIKRENAPFYWLLESPLLSASEKLLNENSNGHKNPDRNEIKKNFTKWIIAAEPGQKKIFASITLRAVKNSAYALTFIEIIYHALILIFDATVRNPHKALEELEKAKSIVDESVNEPGIKKELNYFILLYKGFAYLVLGDNEEASKELSYAIDNKTHGITAKFYFSYLSAIQNREDFTKALIKEILDYDLEKLKYSIDNHSIILLNFFMHNPAFPNIFHYNEFSAYSDYIQTELIENQLDTKKVVANLYKRLNQLKKFEFDEHYTDEMRQTIKFLYDVNEQHSNNQTVFLSFAAEYINEKFHNVLDDIINNIKEKLYENYNRVMALYQKTLDESEKLSEQYSKEVDDIKSSLQKKLATSIQQIEEYVKDALWEVEEKKKNLNYQSNYDPAVSFRNSMSYDVVVSIIVFIIGGIAGYFNNSDYFDSDFYVMLGKIILTGVKWSSLTFVIGFFISVFISG